MRIIPLLLLAIVLGSAAITCAQGPVFLQGNHFEMVVSSGGYYHTTQPAPLGYHPTPIVGSTGFGAVSDVQRSSWLGPTFPAYCGDYFSPGSAVEGFTLAANGQPFEANTAGSATGNMIPGIVTSAENGSGLLRYAIWEGVAIGGTMNVKQTTLFFRNRQYVYTIVDLCNSATGPINDIYYSRNWDPDNEYAWGGSFATSHEVIAQPPLDTIASIRSEGQLYGCYMETVSTDPTARASYGGFFPGSPENSWNGTFPFQLSGSNVADESNQLSFNLGDLNVSECTCLSYVSIFKESERENALARLPIACTEITNWIQDPTGSNLMEILDPFNPALSFKGADRSEEALDPNGEIAIFPNPATGFATIDLSGFSKTEGIRIRLIDFSGRMVASRQFTPSTESYLLDLADVDAGLYVVQLETGNDRFTSKLLVQ